jgi:hypothetical protein
MGTIHPDVFRAYLSDHLHEQSILAPFLATFDVTYVFPPRRARTDLSGYFLRPEKEITDSYGFTQEILLIYSPFPTLQARTIQTAEELLTRPAALGRVETLVIFLVSEMSNPENWISTYLTQNRESRMLVPFSADALRQNRGDPWYVRNILSRVLFNRDLFNYRLPLERDLYFFGRDDLLLEFIDSAKASENRGVFGLRKTGKTSFLYKFIRTINEQKIGYTLLYDCKDTSVRSLHWSELLRRICDDICRLHNVKIKVPTDERLLSRYLADILLSIRKQRKVILIFDDFEFITPLSVDDLHWHDEFVPFWQSIWSAQSARRNLSVVLAGLNATPCERDRVGRVQNPLFAIVAVNYIRGLGSADLRRMILILGRRMGLFFDDGAIEYLSARYGAHPLLTRLVCSSVHQEIRALQIDRPLVIDPAFLTKNEEERDSKLVYYCSHIVSELKEFYPDEYNMFELLATKQIREFMDFAIFPEYIRHLREYGLITYDVDGLAYVQIPVIGKYVALEKARNEGRRTILRVITEKHREEWRAERTILIVEGVRELERMAQAQGLALPFGPTSFPEADRFRETAVVSTRDEFVSFIGCCYRTFVESIDKYGASVGKTQYFYNEMSKTFPRLQEALTRVRLYRNDVGHLLLYPKVASSLSSFLKADLEGRPASVVEEVWFVLQQCVLDGLFNALQAELTRLGR